MGKVKTSAPGYETVWAILQEVGRKQAELTKSQKETDRQIKETDLQIKETDRQIKDYNRRFGEFHNRFGEIVEYLVAPNLCEKFREFGFDFQRANNNTRVSDHKNDIHFEIDVFLENYKKAMLVEVKTKPLTEDVKEHVKRLEKMRKYADLHNDKRLFLGAVAGVVMTASVKKYALKQGFFIIEPSGETFNITAPAGHPKEW